MNHKYKLVWFSDELEGYECIRCGYQTVDPDDPNKCTYYRDEMINMLKSISNYLMNKDESPKASSDLYKVIIELERLWKLEDES